MNIGGKTKGLTLMIGVGLCTLQSLYLPGLGSIFTLIGLLILILGAFPLKSLDFGVSVYAASIVILLVFYMLLNLGRPMSNADLLSSFSTVIMVCACPLVYSRFDEDMPMAVRAVRVVIVFHVFWLLVQAVYWVGTSEYLDMLSILIGQDSSSMSRKGLILFGQLVPRFSGLFNEPGTFSVIVMSLVIVYYSHVRKIDFTIAAGIFASLATMSLFGILLVLMLVSVFSLGSRERRAKAIGLSLLLFGIFSLIGGVEAVLNRFSSESDYSGLEFRVEMIADVFGNTDALLFGYGIEQMPDYFVVNDNGLWFAFIANFGVVGILLVFSLFGFVAVKTKSLECIALLVLILMTKLKFTYPLFWVLLMFLALSGKKTSAARA